MNPVDVKPSMYFDFDQENNKEGPKFKVGDHVRISKYKNIFAKDYVPNWSAEVKNTVPRTNAISDFNGEKISKTLKQVLINRILLKRLIYLI